jgi:8-oxo-dGTP diphosphatase
MTTIERTDRTRQVYFHDPAAPLATVVAPSVFVAVRGLGGRLLLVRRCDSGAWEMPGGPVGVGDSAVAAAVRETAAFAGISVVVTGVVGLFTDPSHVIRCQDGQVCQQFSVLFRARSLGHGVPHGDLRRTSEAAWVAFVDLPGLAIEPLVRSWIAEALAQDDAPHLG